MGTSDKDKVTKNNVGGVAPTVGVNPFPSPEEAVPSGVPARPVAPIHQESKMPTPATSGLGASTSNQTPEASNPPFST